MQTFPLFKCFENLNNIRYQNLYIPLSNTKICIMTKKTKKIEKKGAAENAQTKDASSSMNAGVKENPAALQEKRALEKLPKEVQEKLKTIKAKLEKFQKRILEKFDKYIMGMTLLPPPKPSDQKQPIDQKQPVDKDKIKKIESVVLLEEENKNYDNVAQGLKKGLLLSNNVARVRDLINEPADKVTPIYLANEAKKIAKESNGSIKVKIFGKAEIEKMGMGGLSGVSKGSAQEPKFIILDYNSKKKDPFIFVGKGITFDSGGLDVKPATYMEDMRCDMAGAATVLYTVKSASQLKLNKRVIAIVPTCENLLGSKAYKQGDVLTAYNGKTIEIWHTDAEGR